MLKQYRISTLIKALQEQKKQHGNLLVALSIDEEGNGFNPMGEYVNKDEKGNKEIMLPFSNDKKTLTLWP